MELKRLAVVTGHYGSGKTEFAVNLAVKLCKQGKKVIIVDLDIVNPYFRTNDAKARLEALGIRVIVPEFAGSNLDLPSLPSDIYTAFDNEDSMVVFDVGGDDKGAIALGRYNRYFVEQGYDMFIVANTRRPLTKIAEEIVEMVREIEMASRLKATGLVNNTNLMGLTTVENVEQGQEIIEVASAELGIPISFISGKNEILGNLKSEFKTKAFDMDIYLELL